ncbi:MAG: hypothetical protein PHQ95_04075 [Candidatus Gracilibacteria bacterium]|nr:hypothetical protein [Candidatus Gracilibacteria bacterium]
MGLLDLEINTISQIDILRRFCKNVLSKTFSIKNSRVLLIMSEPIYFNLYLNKILFLYFHILKVDLDIVYLENPDLFFDVEKEKHKEIKISDFDSFYSNSKVSEILGYKLNFNFLSLDEIYNNDSYKLIVVSSVSFAYNFDFLLKKISGVKKVHFFLNDGWGAKKEFPDIIGNKLIEKLAKYDEKSSKNKKMYVDLSQREGFIFSNLFSLLYFKNINFKSKIFDLLAVGRPKGRDFELIKFILTKNATIKVLFLVNNEADFNTIKNMFIGYKGVKIGFNGLSYENFFKLISLSKIVVNCLAPGFRSSLGITSLQIVASTSSIMLSKKNIFYTKCIKNGIDGFLYRNKYEFNRLVNDILFKVNMEDLEKIALNRKKRFDESMYLEKIIESFIS